MKVKVSEWGGCVRDETHGVDDVEKNFTVLFCLSVGFVSVAVEKSFVHL